MAFPAAAPVGLQLLQPHSPYARLARSLAPACRPSPCGVVILVRNKGPRYKQDNMWYSWSTTCYPVRGQALRLASIERKKSKAELLGLDKADFSRD